MIKSEKHSAIEIARDYLARLGRPAGISKKDWHSFNGCQLLHTCIAVDVLEHMDYETFVIQWCDILMMSPFEYLEMFQQLQKALIALVRGEVESSTLVDRVKSLPEFSPFQGWIQAIVSNDQDDRWFFRSLYQLLAFPLRLDLPGLAKADIDDFLLVNSERCHFAPSDRLKAIAREVIDNHFCRLVLQHYRPQHGPGAVSFPGKGCLRSAALSASDKDKQLDMTDVNLAFSLFAGNRNVTQGFLDLFQRTPVKVVDVPKSWKKRRIIAVESSTAMYNQQGFRNGLYKAIKKDSLLNRFINLEHPEYNGDLARDGSLDGSYGTIDLSSASDTVGYRFVKELFQDTPLWKYLDVAHSDSLEISGDEVKSNVFATMGNAVCFPVETLIFTLIVLEAEDSVCSHKPFRVYGDDIVASSDTCEELLYSLTSYGFIINEDKTFTNVKSRFRESCGYEWYNGGNVTPLRISRKFAGLPSRHQHSQVLGLVDLTNAAYIESYMSLYRFLVQYFIDLGLTFPFSKDGTYGIVNHEYLGCNTAPTFFDVDSQNTAIVADRVTVKTKTRKRSQLLALREWLSNTKSRDAAIEEAVVTSTSSELVGFTWSKHAFKYVLQTRPGGV